MFTQKISMDCTKEQYEKYLKEELLKMGYEMGYDGSMAVTFWKEETIIVNNTDNEIGILGTLMGGCKEEFGRTYLGSFNAPLFLALAAMTDKAEGNYGEYVIGLSSGMFYKMKQDDKILPEFYNLRKATKDEIIARFSKIEPDTNYDAAKEFVKDFCYRANNLKVAAICDNIHQSAKKTKEQENAIKLLRENGYKILKPKTWEEV